MAKTYTAASTATAGQVYTASAHNTIVTNVNNFIVPPAARILQTADIAVANNSWTDFTGFTSTNASEDFDTDGMVTLSATASCMTVQTAGLYLVTANMFFAANATGNRVVSIAKSSGGVITALCTNYQTQSASGLGVGTLATIGSFAVGDLIRVRVYQSSGGSLNLIWRTDSDVQYGQGQVAATWIGRTS